MFFSLKHIGLCLILLGVAALAAEFLLRLTMLNAMLVVPLTIIIVGLALYVWGEKSESAY